MHRRISLIVVSACSLCASYIPVSAAAPLGAGGPPPSIAAGQPNAASALPIGELADRRARNAKTERNANGSYTTTVTTGPINYRDSHGKWQIIDSSLVPATSTGYAWHNKANSFSVDFKQALAANFMRFDARGASFDLTLDGASSSEGTAKGSRISYPHVLPQADLVYDLGATGVKETIQLSAASAPDHFRFILTPPSKATVEARQTRDGSWLFYLPPQDEPAFTLVAPHASEALSSSMAVPDLEKNASLAVTRKGATFLIDLAIDSTWLHSPSRSFPIALDPSIVIQPDSQDAYFHGNVPTDGAYHSGAYLHIGDSDTHYDWGAVQFGLSAIPANATITKATLGLYYEGHCIGTTAACGGSTHTIEAHRMTAGWSQASQTQNVTYDPAVLSSTTMTLDSNFRWLSWDVTATAKNWYSALQPNYGLLLKRNSEVLGVSGPALPSNQYTVDSNFGPKLDVTYGTDPVRVDQPTSLHSNGADLSWTAYSSVNAAFQKYEIHRSTVANFTPSTTTLLATITDPSVTTFRDTTAAPSRTFYYNVVANTTASNWVGVTLPADGQASKVLQPGPEGRDSYNYFLTGSTICSTYGTSDHLTIGTDTSRISRAFVSYPLTDIPTGAAIQSATLSLWHYQSLTAADTLHAYRVTRDWQQGSSNSAIGACTGDGLTWYESNGGVAWAGQGGDFASGASDQSGPVSVAANEAPTWNSFDITPIVRQWVNGTAPNDGIMVKLDNEAFVTGNLIRYYAGDYVASSSLRPKLTLAYTDGSHTIAPTVGVTSPVAGATVRGSSVALTATAIDDRRVDRVDFSVDGTTVGTSTVQPFTSTWNSSTVGNGSHTVTAKGYDDAGNITTSGAITMTVSNYSSPTTSITAPPVNSTVIGTATVSANATVAAGLSVSKVEFYFDNTLFGTSTTAPYSASWNTLDSTQPAFDGTRVLTAKVYDSSGLIAASTGFNVAVGNTNGTKYKGSIGPNAPTSVPQAVIYDPSLGTQTQYPVKVDITNTSATTWSSMDTFVRYRWFSPDSTPLITDSANVALPTSIAPAGSATIQLSVTPPTLAAGVNQALYQLRFDVYDNTAGAWFAVKGNPPLDNPVIVNKALKAALGLERYYQYTTEKVGDGMEQLTNVANGDSLLHWTPFTSPGRGLATVAGLTYNSLENHSDSPAGNNWSLSISSLSRFGDPIDIHPNNADTIAGRSNRWISFIDGDGTPHRFAGFTDANGVVYWIEPPGVHLYLRQYGADPNYWAFTRPDRVTFFYNQTGYPTSVTDRFGNSLSFTLTAVQPGDDPGGPKFHITKVTDASGQGATPAPNRSFNISYYVKADSVKSRVRGKIKSITDHLGHALDFSYYDDGNLLRLTQRGGVNADNSFLADRSWVFTYTTSSGGTVSCTTVICDAPAIPAATNRLNPDPKTPDESTRIYSVLDPNSHETRFDYYGPGATSLDRWKLGTLIDRAGNPSSFSYDTTNLVTTFTPPAPGGQSRVEKYAYDTDGKVTTITNPLQKNMTSAWSSDFAVKQIQEPSLVASRFANNSNGYLLDKWDQLNEQTHLTYRDLAIDGNDVASHWCTSAIAASTPCSPRSIPHASLLLTKTDPLGMPAASTYTWQFIYDPTNTFLTQLKDPLQGVTTFGYNSDGTVRTSTDARNNPPANFTYDANGLVVTAVDPLNHSAARSYDDDGLLKWVRDPNHVSSPGGQADSNTIFVYDRFHRLISQTTPKYPSFQVTGTKIITGTLITTATAYDANSNVISQTGPSYSTTDRFTTTMTYDVMDQQTLVTNPDKTIDINGERTKYQYDSAGRLIQVTLPIGVLSPDANNTQNIFYTYDALDRAVQETHKHVDPSAGLQSLNTVACFDATTGDAVSVTAPKAGLTAGTINCASTTLANTTYRTYDAAHRLTTTKDPDGNLRQQSYDLDGNVTQAKDANTNPTNYSYDQLNRMTRVDQPLIATVPGSPTRYVTTMVSYDADGNQSQLITPRAFDTSRGVAPFNSFTTSYQYDAANRLVRIDLPVDAASSNPNFNTHYYVHRAYDANGNVLWNALPDTNSDPNLVPASKKTNLKYYDTGAIYSSQDPGNPPIRFDYTADGRQSLRVPENGSGALDTAHVMQWLYFSDGTLKQRFDRVNQPLSYQYDANNVLKSAQDAAGGTGEIDLTVSSDDLGRTSKVQQQSPGDTKDKYTTYGYDLNNNVIDSVQNAVEGSVTNPGRRVHYDYDAANWLKDQCALASPPATVLNCAASTSTSDQRIVNQFFATGWEKVREMDQGNGSTGWTPKQTTTWDYDANGKLKTLNTVNGVNANVESHSVFYTVNPADSTTAYVDGNRTRDTYTMAGAGNAVCRTTSCNDDYQYDPRDRVVQETKGSGVTTSYYNPKDAGWLGLDDAGNITQEKIVQAGTTTTKNYQYTGNQLKALTALVGSTTTSDQLYWYNDDGDLWCATTTSGSKATCPLSLNAAAPSSLRAAYVYDSLFRLSSYRAYDPAGTGAQTDCANYSYDPLDRVTVENETHGPSGCTAKTTTFEYLGLTNQMTQEQQKNGSTLLSTKDYSYDIYGHRLTETLTPAGQAATNYTYAYNVHDSVSLLMDPNGAAKASYGYRPYGDPDTNLSGGDANKNDPINPYRYSAKRFDSGSQSLDTGARRFSSDTNKFLQPDQFGGALANLALSQDPLTQNRYSLAGGNPLSFIEWDGHRPIPDGGGGGTSEPSPSVDPSLDTSKKDWGYDAPCAGSYGLPCPVAHPPPPLSPYAGFAAVDTAEGSYICRSGVDICVLDAGVTTDEQGAKAKWVKVRPYTRGSGAVAGHYRTIQGGRALGDRIARAGWVTDFLASAESQFEEDQKDVNLSDSDRVTRAVQAAGIATVASAVGSGLGVRAAARGAAALGIETGPVGEFIIAVTGGIIGGLFGEAASETAKSAIFQFEGFPAGPSRLTVPATPDLGPGCIAYNVCAPHQGPPPIL